MLYCFLQSQACRLMQAAEYASSGAEEKPPERPAPLYVGVAAWTSTASVFAGHLLALLTGVPVPATRTECYDKTVPVSNRCLYILLFLNWNRRYNPYEIQKKNLRINIKKNYPVYTYYINICRIFFYHIILAHLHTMKVCMSLNIVPNI